MIINQFSAIDPWLMIQYSIVISTAPSGNGEGDIPMFSPLHTNLDVRMPAVHVQIYVFIIRTHGSILNSAQSRMTVQGSRPSVYWMQAFQ